MEINKSNNRLGFGALFIGVQKTPKTHDPFLHSTLHDIEQTLFGAGQATRALGRNYQGLESYGTGKDNAVMYKGPKKVEAALKTYIDKNFGGHPYGPKVITSIVTKNVKQSWINFKDSVVHNK